MRLIDRFRSGEQRAVQATTWGQWAGENPVTWSGSNVSTSNSLQLLTVYGCVRLIADSIATLPLDVFRKAGDEQVEIPAPRWLNQPTPDLDRTAWLTQLLTSLLLAGNAYVFLDRDGEGGIGQAIPLDPAQVQVRRDNGRKTYVVGGVPTPPFQMLHIPAVMFPGSDVGLSPVEAARQSIGLGMAAQETGARFFGQGMQMSGVIEHPHEMQPQETKDLAAQWARRHSGTSKAHLPGVLTNGATWKPTGVTNEQAQFLETRRYTAAEVAGQMFLVDPSELGIGVEGTSLTYANLEQRKVRLASVTLQPWIIRIEKAISSVLFNPRFVKFNMSAFLRGDAKTRFETYAIGIRHNVVLPSEARALEDLPPIPGIDDKPLPGTSTGVTPNVTSPSS